MSLTPPYSLLTRTSKGSQLTIDEMDGNLLYLASTLSGSNTITGSVNFTGSLVDFLQVGTVTGSFSGDGSGLTGVISASYAVSASHEIIKEISSSFADVAGGLTGQPSIHVTNITASGNISASGYYYGDGSQLTGISAGQWYDGTTYLSSSLSIKVDSHITASGNISASGNIEASGLISASGDIYTDGYIYVNNGYIYGNRAAFSSHVILHSIYGGAQTATNLAITPSAVNGGGMLLTGPVTASSHISASGTVTGLSGSFSHIYSGGDINIDNQGKLWLDGGVDSYVWMPSNNHIAFVAGDNQTLTVDETSIEVDGYITGSDFIQVAGTPGQHTGVKISSSNSEGDTRDAQMIVPVHGFEIKNSSNNNVFKLSYDHVGINTQYPVNSGYALSVSASSGGGGAIYAIGDISASGNIEATGTGSFNYVTTPIIEGSGSTALLHIEGAISASGDLSIAGFPSVSASLASGGGFTPSLATDLPARNITASANISSSGTVIAGNLNIDATNASSSVSVGIEETIQAVSNVSVTSSGIVNQAYPLGNTGRITQVIGNATLGLGPVSYESDGEQTWYKSGSIELWRQTGEVDLSSLGGKRTVGHSLQYGDQPLVSTEGTYNEFQLFSGENVGEGWAGAHLTARYSGSTDRLLAGFFASASINNPGTPNGVDPSFTIFTGGTHTGPAFNIYRSDDPDNVYNNSPSFTIDSAGHITSSGDISSSGTVIASGVNIDTTDTSASFDIGSGEHIIPVLGLVNASSSAIISQAHPSGRIGRTTEIIGDVNMDIGPAAYPIDGHHVFYHSGSRELWKSSGEWDLSALGYPRTVGNQIQYGDGNLIGTIEANKFNDYRLIVGENVTDIWGGAYLMGRQSGSTYGANTQYAGFFVSASLGLPGTPQGHDKAFTIYTGQQTGPAFNIYNADDPDNQSGTDPVFSIAANGALGNVTASNISSSGALYGNLLTPAQISITQVGMLTSLTVNGNTMLSGNVTQSGHISSSGDLIGDNLQVETRTMPIDHVPGGAGVRSGDIINLGNSTTVPGLIYALTGSSYEYVAAQSGSGALASSSLAVAIGTNSNTNGMLMRGFVNLGHDPGGPIGGPVYLTANGSASYSAPTATGDIVRVLGHNFGNNSIYFNPSNDWIVRS